MPPAIGPTRVWCITRTRPGKREECGELDVGNHNWRVEVLDGTLKASKSGSLSVSKQAANLFDVALTAWPVELEGGGLVFLQVHVWNHANSAISVKGFIEDEEGAVIKRIDGYEGRIPAKGYKNLTFTYNLAGVGNHTFKLFLDNYDGEPNGAGEEHWSNVAVEVKPMKGSELKQVGFDCNDPEFNWKGTEYKASLVCRAFIYNPTQNDISLNAVAVKEWHTDNTDFTNSLGPWVVVDYPDTIRSSETSTITFRNTAHTSLHTLEMDLFGVYASISLTYIISPQHGDDVHFTGYDTINIRQDDKDVVVDGGTQAILDFIGGEELVVAVRTKDALKTLPFVVQFFREAWGWIND
ncbi:hypothetical protein A3L02_09465 [Thermococcus celer Vu 13 = JCM 8558]|uniref:Uncharacterized protein n=2 Tax=Thermococcus celer TaxID=2264 RepID=A0A218P4F3_THECE|nr:hypothetical protein A3L02_09465 [Thermococcus celer Vu 13 = JCM 8558]